MSELIQRLGAGILMCKKIWLPTIPPLPLALAQMFSKVLHQTLNHSTSRSSSQESLLADPIRLHPYQT